MLSFYIKRILVYIFYVFPIKKNKVFFSSYEGTSISCNPKYICSELKTRFGEHLVSVWEYNHKRTTKEEGKTIYVKHNSLAYVYHIMTSKVLISNTGISACFPLRKKQFTINTWHGAGCYKKVGKDLSDTYIETIRRRYEEKNTNYYLSGCAAWTHVFSEAVLSSPIKFLPTGSPRIDYLFNDVTDGEVERIKGAIGIKAKIVLYAPTYRGDRDTPGNAQCPLDIDLLLDALEKRFGGEWIFAYRCHYATASLFKGNDRTIDLSGHEDMQELLAIADILISDYSSSIWDYSFTGKPCFLYCYDLDKYTEERDFYMPIKDWHFPVSLSINELIKQIDSFNDLEYAKNVAAHHRELGSFESGNATNTVVNLIQRELQD